MVTVVASLVMLLITDVKANTPGPVCNVTSAYPRAIALCPARFKTSVVAHAPLG